MSLETTWNASFQYIPVLEMTLVKSTAVKALAIVEDCVYVEFNKGKRIYIYQCGEGFCDLIKQTVTNGGSLGRLMRHLYTEDPAEFSCWGGEVSYKNTL
jgi:hypothetical protein